MPGQTQSYIQQTVGDTGVTGEIGVTGENWRKSVPPTVRRIGLAGTDSTGSGYDQFQLGSHQMQSYRLVNTYTQTKILQARSDN